MTRAPRPPGRTRSAPGMPKIKHDHCLDCGVDTIDLGELYMVRDETWLAAHPKRDGMLCVSCLETRLGRKLITDDFTWCPLNLANLFTGSDLLRANECALDAYAARGTGDGRDRHGHHRRDRGARRTMIDNSLRLRQRLAIPMPPRLARRPRTKHGLPVPYIADQHEDGSPNLGKVVPSISGDCHRQRLCSLCGEKLAPAERTFITGPGANYQCADPPMHEDCAHYALRVCPHLVTTGSVSVVITAARYRQCTSTDCRGCNDTYYRPQRPFQRLEWWREGVRDPELPL